MLSQDRVLPDPELKENSEEKGESAHKWKFIQIPKTIFYWAPVQHDQVLVRRHSGTATRGHGEESASTEGRGVGSSQPREHLDLRPPPSSM